MAEITLIEAITSQQVINEAERNISKKFPKALPAFRLLVSRSLKIVYDPEPEDQKAYEDAADLMELPILVAAVRQNCSWLVTFYLRLFKPGVPSVTVLRPVDFVLRVRYLMSQISALD